MSDASKYLAPKEVWQKKLDAHRKTVDPNWIDVEQFTTSHLDQDNRELLNECAARNDDAGLPPIHCGSTQAKLMTMISHANSSTHALEIGTLGGLTAIRLAAANENLRITTIEIHEVYANIARENIQRAGFADRIEVLQGEAIEVVTKLAAEVEKGKRAKFGLAFLDADGANNWNYIDRIVQMSVPKACIFLDSINVKGLLSLDSSGEKQVENSSRSCVIKAGQDPRIDSVVMQTVGDKGWAAFMICIVKDTK